MKKENWKFNFILLYLSQALSLISSSVMQLAIVWHITMQTQSALYLSLASLMGFLPQAFLGLFIGVWVDRWNKKLIMIGADLLTAFGAFLMLVLLNMDQLTIPWIMFILLIRSLGTAFHSPTLNVVTSLIVPSKSITKVNGYAQTIMSASFLIGPALAAMLYAVKGLILPIYLDIICAFFAILSLAIIKFKDIKKVEQHDFKNELIDGLKLIVNDKGLLTMILIGCSFLLVFMPVNAFFPLMSIDYFAKTTYHASLIEVVFAAGMLLGGLLLGIWGGFKQKKLTFVLALALMSLGLITAGILPKNGFYLFVVATFIMGVSSPLYSGIATSSFQLNIKPELLGRFFSIYTSILSIITPISLIISGFLAENISLPLWFLAAGIICLLLSIIAYKSKELAKFLK